MPQDISFKDIINIVIQVDAIASYERTAGQGKSVRAWWLCAVLK